jgi:hypothetical protein
LQGFRIRRRTVADRDPPRLADPNRQRLAAALVALAERPLQRLSFAVGDLLDLEPLAVEDDLGAPGAA